MLESRHFRPLPPLLWVALICSPLPAAAASQVTLDAPNEAPTGAYIPVHWEGPGDNDDFIVVVPAGSGERTFPPAYAYPRDDNPVQLALGDKVTAGSYEIRYLTDGIYGKILAKRTLKVVRSQASLQLPAKVAPGATFQVQWDGWGGDQDRIGIAEPETDPTRFDGQSVAVTEGTPVSLKAPDVIGQYVVRYQMGASKELAVEVPLTVSPMSEDEFPTWRITLNSLPGTEIQSDQLGAFLTENLSIEFGPAGMDKLSVKLRVEVISQEGGVLGQYESKAVEVEPGKTYPCVKFCSADQMNEALAPGFGDRRKIGITAVRGFPDVCLDAIHAVRITLLSNDERFVKNGQPMGICF